MKIFMKKSDMFNVLFSEDGASVVVPAGSRNLGLRLLSALSCPWR